MQVLYEDNHLLVVVKPKGILSQEDHTKDQDMLTLCKKYLKDKYQKPGNVFLGLVHRLDRNTSGIMVFAKTSKCASRLSESIRRNDFIKKYYAVVKGEIEDHNHYVDYLTKDETLVKSFVTDKTNGKLASLSFKKIKSGVYNNITYSLCDIELETGRHHQIRVQFASRLHPLLGDTLYEDNSLQGFLLHAYYLSFPHPITKERLEFISYPDDESWQKFL